MGDGDFDEHKDRDFALYEVQNNNRTLPSNSYSCNGLTVFQQTPKRVTTTKTITLGTITKSAYKVVPTVITKTKTKTCSIPRKQNHRDPWCTITPTVAFAAALETGVSASPTPTAGSTRRRRDALRSQLENREEFLAARKARLAAAQGLEKRGLDLETITIGEPNTSLWKTETAWTTMPASTVTSTVESTTSVTTTSTQTVYKGVTKVITTVTAVSLDLQSTKLLTCILTRVAADAYKDKDEVDSCAHHVYNHEAPYLHNDHQVGTCVKHGYLQGQGWQAGVRRRLIEIISYSSINTEPGGVSSVHIVACVQLVTFDSHGSSALAHKCCIWHFPVQAFTGAYTIATNSLISLQTRCSIGRHVARSGAWK